MRGFEAKFRPCLLFNLSASMKMVSFCQEFCRSHWCMAKTVLLSEERKLDIIVSSPTGGCGCGLVVCNFSGADLSLQLRRRRLDMHLRADALMLARHFSLSWRPSSCACWRSTYVTRFCSDRLQARVTNVEGGQTRARLAARFAVEVCMGIRYS